MLPSARPRAQADDAAVHSSSLSLETKQGTSNRFSVNAGGTHQIVKRLKVGDYVCWNSEAGPAARTIIAVHTGDFDYKGHVHHASKDDPQYEIRSDKTGHGAAHRGAVLELAPRKGQR